MSCQPLCNPGMCTCWEMDFNIPPGMTVVMHAKYDDRTVTTVFKNPAPEAPESAKTGAASPPSSLAAKTPREAGP